MSRVAIPLAALLACAVLGAPAGAQPGQLYEPFPEPAGRDQIVEFIRGLPEGGGRIAGGLSEQELENGAFVGAPSPGVAAPRGASGPATARAAAGGDFGPTTGWALGAALLVLTLGSARVLAGRRP